VTSQLDVKLLGLGPPWALTLPLKSREFGTSRRQLSWKSTRLYRACKDTSRSSCQAGHWSVQPVSETGGEVLSPAMIVSTLNKSSGSLTPFGRTSPMKAEVIS
jgi:hypothetical protein